MRFLSMIRVQENTGQRPSEQVMHDMGHLMQELTRAGKLISTAGLKPTSEGVRMRSNHGKITMTDGPFVETKEVVGGFAMLEAASMAEAIELTRRFLAVHGDEFNVECEIRPLAGPEFGARGLDPAQMKACGEQEQTA